MARYFRTLLTSRSTDGEANYDSFAYYRLDSFVPHFNCYNDVSRYGGRVYKLKDRVCSISKPWLVMRDAYASELHHKFFYKILIDKELTEEEFNAIIMMYQLAN